MKAIVHQVVKPYDTLTPDELTTLTTAKEIPDFTVDGDIVYAPGTAVNLPGTDYIIWSTNEFYNTPTAAHDIPMVTVTRDRINVYNAPIKLTQYAIRLAHRAHKQLVVVHDKDFIYTVTEGCVFMVSQLEYAIWTYQDFFYNTDAEEVYEVQVIDNQVRLPSSILTPDDARKCARILKVALKLVNK